MKTLLLKKRVSGLSLLGDIPWGYHFCQFYQAKEDLLDILIPYFQAGLENNEYCVWVMSEPLTTSEAIKAATDKIPNFKNYLKKGQIEIFSYADWYLKGGIFNAKRVLSDWVKKIDDSLKKGYDGLRVTGNTFWLEDKDWQNFTNYEASINEVINKYKILVLCAYSLEKCSGLKVIDVIRNHQKALIKSAGEWIIIQSSELEKAEKEINHLASFPRLNIMPIVELDMNSQIIYANPAAVNLFPDIYKKGIKHPLLSELSLEDIKNSRRIVREVQIGNNWYKQDLAYVSEMDSIQIYNTNITISKEMEQRQRNFLAILGHELRNPLSSISLFIELLESKIPNDLSSHKTFKKLQNQVENMSDLIKDLLDISRIELGKIEIHQQKLNIIKIIRHVAEISRSFLEKNNQTLEIVVPYQAVTILADPLRIEQILTNLIQNASKFSKGKTSIRLSMETSNDQVFIKVKDYRIGISPASLSRIFDLFVQENSISEIKNEGLGIGLYLSRRLIRLHGGDINVYCEGPNQGSEFVINLPIIKCKPEKNRLKPKKTVSGPSSKNKVLIVDDNVVLTETYQEVIKNLGHETEICYEGKTALKIIPKFKPDIALIDLGMPGMDGITLVEKIRGNKNMHQPILVAVTGYGQESDKKRALDVGFNDYIIKPLEISQLSKILSKHY